MMAGIFSPGFKFVGSQTSTAISVPSLIVTYILWRSATRRSNTIDPTTMQANIARRPIHRTFFFIATSFLSLSEVFPCSTGIFKRQPSRRPYLEAGIFQSIYAGIAGLFHFFSESIVFAMAPTWRVIPVAPHISVVKQFEPLRTPSPQRKPQKA